MAMKMVIGYVVLYEGSDYDSPDYASPDYWLRIYENGKAKFTWELGELGGYNGEPDCFKATVHRILTTTKFLSERSKHIPYVVTIDGVEVFDDKFTLELLRKSRHDTNGVIVAQSGPFEMFFAVDEFLEALLNAEVVKWDGNIYDPVYMNLPQTPNET